MKILSIIFLLPIVLFSQETLYLNDTLLPDGVSIGVRNTDLDLDGRVDILKTTKHYENNQICGFEWNIYSSVEELSGEPTYIFYEESPLGFGLFCEGGHDVNGDGYDDLVVSNPGADFLYIYFGSENMDTEYDMLLRGSDNYHGIQTYQMGFGIFPKLGGDFNGDGYSDIYVASQTDIMFEMGFMHVFNGGPDIDKYDDFFVKGEIGEDWGTIPSIGDLNGDGYDDLVVKGKKYPETRYQMIIFMGSESGLIEEPRHIIPNQQGVLSFTAEGDYNGDGKNDLVFQNTDYSLKILYFDDDFEISNSKTYSSPGSIIAYFSKLNINNDGYDDLGFSRFSSEEIPIMIFTGPIDFDSPPQYQYENSDPNQLAGDGFFNMGDILDKGYDQIITGPYQMPGHYRTNLLVRDKEDSGIDETLHTMELKAQNYPDPFNPTTNIYFDSREFQTFTLKIFNLKGEVVYNKLYNSNNKRKETIEFNGSNLSSGTYLYTITLEDPIKKWNKVFKGKMCLIK
ncbi:MAG: hypothetical protein CR982_06630 [Candidatus Cloacimonadota bacterium]|nr:MAG: hypothetical protein CR982_06630 [Candidatus Cloacimonadota bacterium]PIE77842.1 MAG: hypothetical protein CSA15_11135 [Candidatus Delongbacteria bacterium]